MRVRKVYRYVDCDTLQVLHRFSGRRAQRDNASAVDVEVVWAVLDDDKHVSDSYTEADARRVMTALEINAALLESLTWIVKAAPNTTDMQRLLQFSGLDDVDSLQRKLSHWDYQLERAREVIAKAVQP